MSTGARLPLEQAQRVAAALFERWRLDPLDCFVVGSVRRGRPEVGDLEILVPAAPRGNDPLYPLIEATMDGDGIFAGGAERERIGRVVKGLKPGFLAASLVVRPYEVEIPCQVFRYQPGNLGWSLIMRTGPADLGKWFLNKWKTAHGIPAERPASVKGFLVDADGRPVHLETEAECFAHINMSVVAPARRDEFIARFLP